LDNRASDRILAVLPISFDAGLSQITTAFHSRAFVQLHNYLLQRDIQCAIERYRITGVGAIPPMWIPLACLDWPAGALDSLRYITNTGGAIPLNTLTALRKQLTNTKEDIPHVRADRGMSLDLFATSSTRQATELNR
jgi:acyl-CoA synthetase (AMP-forming)/AMP-acid ligase II